MNNDDILQQIYILLGQLDSPIKNKNNQSDMLYSDWLNTWFLTYNAHLLNKRSYRDKKNDIEKIIIPALGNYRLYELNGLILQKFLNTINGNNARVKILNILRASLRQAVFLQMLSYNPCTGLQLPRYRKKHYPPIEYTEQVALYNAFKYRHYKEIFKFLVCTGLRPSEMFALDWYNDINYYEQFIKVNKSMDVKTGIISDITKTSAGERIVPFSDGLVPTLVFLQKFSNSSNFSYEMFRTAFRRYVLKLGYKLCIYSCRHTFISMCGELGLYIKIVQKIVGHKDVNVTLNVYSHLLRQGNSPFREYILELKDKIEKNNIIRIVK